MIRIICPVCKNGYLEAGENVLSCPECKAQIPQSEENLFSGIQYYNEKEYDKANDCLMKYIVKNGAEPRAIFYKALCDGFNFDEDSTSVSETYEKLIDALQSTTAVDFPRYLAVANDECAALEKALAESHIRLFIDADAEKIKKEVSAIINIQNEAKAFRVKLNALTNDYNAAASAKLSVKFSDCYLVEPELATQIGQLKFEKIAENIASHTVFTGILSTDIKNLEIYYRCIVMFFEKNRQKYEFLMESSKKFTELSQLLEEGQYNTIKGTDSIGEKLKSAGYDFFQESLKDTDDEFETQTETVVVLEPEVIEAEPEAVEEVTEPEDISSVSTPDETPAVENAEADKSTEAEAVIDETDTAEEAEEPEEIEKTQVVDIPQEDTKDSTPPAEAEAAQDEASEEAEKTEEADAAEDTAEEIQAGNAAEETTVVEIADVIDLAAEEPENEASTVEEIEIPQDADEGKINLEEVKAAQETVSVTEPNVKIKHKTHYKPFVAMFCIIAGIVAIICATVIPQKLNAKSYAEAGELVKQKKYKEAAAVYAELEDYEDSAALYKAAQYNYAAQLEKDENYELARSIYEGLGEYEDSMAKTTSCIYNIAIKTLDDEKFDEAKSLFESIPEYADSQEKIKECSYQKACAKIAEKKFEDAITILLKLEDYKPAEEKILEAKYKYAEANPSKDNKTTVAFLEDLIEARYKDSVLLRKKILGEEAVSAEAEAEAEVPVNGKVVSVINYSASDLKKNLKEADRTKPIYFHATVTDSELYGKNLTAKFTTSVGYTERKSLTLSESDNTYHLMYPRTNISNYTVEFSLLDSTGKVLVSQTITIV